MERQVQQGCEEILIAHSHPGYDHSCLFCSKQERQEDVW